MRTSQAIKIRNILFFPDFRSFHSKNKMIFPEKETLAYFVLKRTNNAAA